MNTPLRLLRACVEDIEGPRAFTEADLRDRARVMDLGIRIFTRHAPRTVSLAALAEALALSRSRLRWLFSDMDGLLGAILLRHLADLAGALRAAPSAPAARDAYRRATREASGELTEAHALYVRHWRSLPEDQQDLLAPLRAELARLTGAAQGEMAISLLDKPQIPPAQVELVLRQAAAGGAQPAPAEASPAAVPKPERRLLASSSLAPAAPLRPAEHAAPGARTRPASPGACIPSGAPPPPQPAARPHLSLFGMR